MDYPPQAMRLTAKAIASLRRFAHEFPADYVPRTNERAVSDAAPIGTMHGNKVHEMMFLRKETLRLLDFQ